MKLDHSKLQGSATQPWLPWAACQPASTGMVGAVLVFCSLLLTPLTASATDEYEEGFLTTYLNRGLERVMPPDTAAQS